MTKNKSLRVSRKRKFDIPESEKLAIVARALAADCRGPDMDRVYELYHAYVLGQATYWQLRFRNIPRQEFIAAGYEGIEKAVRNFNPALGNKFITFLIHTVRTKIGTMLTTRIEGSLKMSRARRKRGERSPEVSIDQLLPDGKKRQFPASDPGPLDLLLAKEHSKRNSRLERMILSGDLPLTERERDILWRRFFGGEDGEGETLQVVAKSFRLSKERVRQIEVKALSKIRHARPYLRELL